MTPREIHSNDDTGKLVAHLFRHEGGKMVSVLARLLGFARLDTAQDIVQETLLSAMTVWGYKKIPDNPSAWLYRVARNKAIDHLRRERAGLRASEQLLEQIHLQGYEDTERMFLADEIEDSVLRMMFACCHPEIPVESQIALALKTVGGMTSREIASSFLTSEDTINKRIYRALEKIRSKNIPLEVPVSATITTRLQAVLHVLYLLFNEGYHSSHDDQLIRRELCLEAMRLCQLLTRHQRTNTPVTSALMALMCFQASRFDARLDGSGNLITLRHQDRSRWNKLLIDRGFYYLEGASEPESISVYHLEAGIASLHAASRSFESTDWKSIHHLYEALYTINPTPFVALNKAIASAYAISARHALDELTKIKGLERNHLYHASMGEVHLELNHREEAGKWFRSALGLATTKGEKQFLTGKIHACE